VLLQNPAESRGSGGFVGGYVLLAADDGRVRVAGTGTSSDLNTTPIPTGAAPEEARTLFGDRLERWNTFNDSPHFPTTASLSQVGLAARGSDVQGVIGLDPEAVAAMLSVTGPIEVEGRKFTADDVAQFFTVDVYLEYPDSAERDAVSMRVVSAALEAFLSRSWDPAELAEAMVEPVEQGRVRVWSAEPGEEEWLGSTSLGGIVPDTSSRSVAVAFSNSAANKMDAFVETSVTYVPGECPSRPRQHSSVEVTVLNDAPVDLPLESGNYGRADATEAPEGSTSTVVYVYAPVGAGSLQATLDGEPVELYGGIDRNRPVWFAYLPIDRGQERVLHLDFIEPTVMGDEPRVLTHGMVNPVEVAVEPDNACYFP